jgi:hypothetical protein
MSAECNQITSDCFLNLLKTELARQTVLSSGSNPLHMAISQQSNNHWHKAGHSRLAAEYISMLPNYSWMPEKIFLISEMSTWLWGTPSLLFSEYLKFFCHG